MRYQREMIRWPRDLIRRCGHQLTCCQPSVYARVWSSARCARSTDRSSSGSIATCCLSRGPAKVNEVDSVVDAFKAGFRRCDQMTREIFTCPGIGYAG